ncbi:MAG: TetR-like C-terminal domain-containing protein, partial [Candidatus Halalkalibacterium sp. M3_1C_030]
LNNRLEESISASQDPLEKLNTLARVYVEFALEHPKEYRIIYTVSSDQMSRYPKEKFRKARRGYEIVTEVLEEGVRKNLLDEDRPRLAAYTFWAQLHGVMSVVLTKRLDNRLNRQEFIEQAIDHIIHGFHVRTALPTN